jgi:hypothetical protein
MRRREALAREYDRARRVRDAATALTQRGLYFSASHVADLLGDRNVMRSHTAQAVWREVLSDLGRDRPNMDLQAFMAQIA